MEILERIWEIISGLGASFMSGFERLITSIFGSANARYLKKLYPRVEAINALEDQTKQLSDEQLKAKTDEFRSRLDSGETLDDILTEAFAVCREGGRRFLEMRHYDVQLIGGMILHDGNIAEMVTGEGKTLVATLPAYLNALEGKGVHVITVNDYLARRDMEWMSALYTGLGLTVGAIQSGMDSGERQKAYACDITYGTNNEFGFDYLRDNMRVAARDDDRYPKRDQQSQGNLHYAIIDEVDNILIDEARTPLIISGPAEDDITKYSRADKIARQLQKDAHFEVKEKEHTVNLTDEGVRAAEKLAGVESFYTAGNMQWPHLIDNALKAHHLYKRDVNYVIQGGKIVIVDEFTGRLMEGRQWSDGLHQAVEAKEGVSIKQENQTLATITLQNFFKLYDKLSGMTGTAMTEAGEFWKIYKLDVIAVPTNRPLQRLEHTDVIYRSEKEKYVAIADEIERMCKYDTLVLGDGEILTGTVESESDEAYQFRPAEKKKIESIDKSKVSELEQKGRPILVGTVSIEKSERLSKLLEQRGIQHEVLNAKHHKREAEIVAQAGRRSAVTIATNMAGRGTDIILGGNPETMAWAQLQDKYETRLDVPPEEWDQLVTEIDQRDGMKAEGESIKGIGGLHIVGTERHEARRIDLQLRGRCGRQGDPGSSRFYLSLEDDLMRIFAGEWVKNMLTRLGMKEGEAIESRMVSRRVEGAQKKVEERNFEIRKSLLEYDEVMDEQRKRVYRYRQNILDGTSCRDLILDMIDSEIEEHLSVYLAPDYGASTFAAEAGSLLGVELDPKEFRGTDFESADKLAKDEAERMAESQVLDAIEENLPDEEDQSEWNWAALAKFANTRWALSLRDRDLKKIGRDGVAEVLIDKAHQAIQQIDLEECERFLDPAFGASRAADWIHFKFGIEMPVEGLQENERPASIERVRELAHEAYDQREAEYPVMAGMVHFTMADPSGAKRFDREKLIEWAQERFGVELSLDDIKSKQREEVRGILVEHSKAAFVRARQAADEVRSELHEKFSDLMTDGTLMVAPERLEALSQWLEEKTETKVPVARLRRLDPDQLEKRVTTTLEDHFRPEMSRMERSLLLQILDTTWKDHLLAMDHLRSSVSLRGYAQVDPKVEYKREGMRQFEQMWSGIGEHVTNLVFKMEDLNEQFVGSTWQGATEQHEEAPDTIAEQQRQGIEGSQGDQKLEPIRNRERRLGRNEPCHCGSGKKYKNCCMRNDRAGGGGGGGTHAASTAP